MPDTRNDTQRNHLRYSPPRRSGKTPEAKVSAAIDKYLALIGAITIRTNAGSWADESGNIIMGAKAGTSDKTCCLQAQEGRSAPFCAIEVKSATGKQTEAQRRYQQRVESIGGLYILAHSVDDVRAALIAAFGAETVDSWEAAGRARQAELRKAKRNV